MPRMQVYLPDDLYDDLKSYGLPASELLQGAVRAELHRRALLEAADAYIEVLVTEVGEPTATEQRRAAALVARLQAGSTVAQAG